MSGKSNLKSINWPNDNFQSNYKIYHFALNEENCMSMNKN